MARVRPAAYAALLFVLLAAASAGGPAPRRTDPVPLAAVGWSPSGSLLVAEIVTGGASASDEYVELVNAGLTPADLAGLEVAYATSTGTTVTRKAAWTASLVLDPGQHLLIANGSGAYASLADAVYTGGLAATGGAIVLRATGGAVVDAVGWGDAANGFVEGSAAPPPAAGQSIERRPGGADGNAADTNDNAADFVVNGSPVPQNRDAGVVTPTPTPDPTPTPAPTATATPDPTAAPTPAPTASPAPTPTPDPTPTPAPTPTATPDPTPAPTSTPPTPAPTVSIASARVMPDGGAAVVEGVLTTPLGALESGRTGFVQDATAGIALYLDAAAIAPLPAGTLVRASGTVVSRYGQRTLRVAAPDVVVLGEASLPAPVAAGTGAAGIAGESLEGLRLRVAGVVVEAPSGLADGLGVALDDGSGVLRLVVGPEALADATVLRGAAVTATGPLGQRDSSGTGSAGYRLYATMPGEFEIWPAPSPTPSPTPSPSPSPTPSPSPSPTPTPSPTPSPSPSPSPTPSPSAAPLGVGAARGVAVGGSASVVGVVTAAAGRIGSMALFVIGDATGGLPVHLGFGMAAPATGTLVSVRGTMAAPYGQTELRLARGGLAVLGSSAMPNAVPVPAGAIGESLEGQLVTVTGSITVGAAKATGGDLVLVVTGDDGTRLKVYADASAGIGADTLRKGLAGSFTGIVGQRASRSGALDGYRLWLRGPDDVRLGSQATPDPAGSPADATSAPTRTEPISTARIRDGSTVTVAGVVTADRTLLDTSGRRAVLEDATGAIELYLPAPDSAVHLGARLQATGTVARVSGAPRLRVSAVTVLGSAAPPVLDLRSAPGAATEWRLVRVVGTIRSVHPSGDRWVAELDCGFGTVPVTALAGAGVPAAAVAAGRRATVVGIVRRPYPTAADRRYAVLPRRPSDVSLGTAAVASAGPAGAGAAGKTPSVGTATGGPPTVDLSALGARVGQRVRVGGLVAEVTADGLRLDDGTASALIVLEGDAADLAALIGPGDALDAVGTVEARTGPVLVVGDPADVTLVGDLGGDATTPPAAAFMAGPESVPPDAATTATAGGSPSLAAGAVLAGVLASAAAAGAVGARRVRERRHLQRRLRRRLATLGGGGAATGAADA